MNPEKPQPNTEQLERQSPNIIERLEGHEEDIQREPLRLREIGNAEFQQEFSPEQREQAQAVLQSVIASSKYNTFNLIQPIFDEYLRVVEEGQIVSLAEILEHQDVASSDDNLAKPSTAVKICRTSPFISIISSLNSLNSSLVTNLLNCSGVKVIIFTIIA